MGFFSWKTADTRESIANIYSNKEVKTVYLIQPNGEEAIEELGYEGYGVFGGKDAYTWVTEQNFPTSILSILNDEEKRTMGIILSLDSKIYKHIEKDEYFSTSDVDLLNKVSETKVNFFDESIKKEELHYIGVKEFLKMENMNELKFSFDKNAVYENLPSSENCPNQGYFLRRLSVILTYKP